MSDLIFPPVATAEYADKIAGAVARGTLKVMPHWLSRASCQSVLDSYHAGRWLLPMQGQYVPTAAVVPVAGDAGRHPFVIPPAEAVAARVSGKPLAGDAGLTGATALAAPSVSVIERRDGARVSSETRSEAA